MLRPSVRLTYEIYAIHQCSTSAGVHMLRAISSVPVNHQQFMGFPREISWSHFRELQIFRYKLIVLEVSGAS